MSFSEERHGLITGSKCGVMFPLKGDGMVGISTYAKQLAIAMYFRFSDDTGSWQTEHGKMGEYHAFNHYETYVTGHIERGEWLRKGDCGGTTDAKVPGVNGVDFKCPVTLEGWINYLTKGVSRDEECQAKMYCYLTGLPYWEIAAYLVETQRMSDNGLVYPVPEEKRMIRIKIEKDSEWEEELLEQTEIVVRLRDEYLAKFKQQFG
jgi:hypothetical protein